MESQRAVNVRGLTPRRKRILECITEFYQKHGVSPTLRQVQQALGYRAVSTVAAHVKALKSSGLLCEQPGRRSCLPSEIPTALSSSRGPDPTTFHWPPFLGFFSPTTGIETLVTPQTFSFPECLVQIQSPQSVPRSAGSSPSTYALKVRGDELFEEGICDGDILFIAVGKPARPGEGVLLREGREWWLRRVEPAGEYLCLESLTQRAPPVYRAAEQIQILGVLVGVWRSFELALPEGDPAVTPPEHP